MSLIILLCTTAYGASTRLSNNQQKFVDMVSKEAQAINKDILKTRSEMLALHNKVKKGDTLTSAEQTQLQKVVAKYRTKPFDHTKENNWIPLLKKIDIIPVSMVIAQAANESGWGQSRFAVQAKNLFGHSCMVPKCGLVPKNRKKGDPREVKRFASHRESIRSYMHNLNTNIHYKKMHDLRWSKRQKNQQISGLHLADGIEAYSELGQRYIKMIKELIRVKGLGSFDT